MNSSMNSAAKALSAFSLMMFASACSGLDSPPPISAPIPELSEFARSECRDPGVDRDAIKAIAETRLALAECRRKKGAAVSQYEDVMARFGPQ